MKHRTYFSLASALALLALTGCFHPPDSAYQNRGTPESFLDVSSEVVNLSVASKTDTQALSNWIAKDAPTRAQLFCNDSAKSCKDAQRILESRSVIVNLTLSPNNTVTLVYERILAHDCSSRYIDPWSPNYNAAPPSFGCAFGANAVQQVSDKRAFVNPNLSDDPTAINAVNNIHHLNEPKSGPDTKYSVTDSAVKSSSSGSN